MGLDKLNPETRAAVQEIFKQCIHEDEGMRRTLEYFAEDGDKGSRISQLFDQAKDLNESFDEMKLHSMMSGRISPRSCRASIATSMAIVAVTVACSPTKIRRAAVG